MYLTDYRERSLKDVITELEPQLFKKVTGLNVKDFELLCSLGVFNASLMNDAIYKFKRYEDSSLSYTGIDKHYGEDIGGFDVVIKKKEFDELFRNQQGTIQDFSKFKVNNSVVKSSTSNKHNDTNRTKEKINNFPSAKTKNRTPELQIGMKVNHIKFGNGKIIKIDLTKHKIKVSFNGGEKDFIVEVGNTNNIFERGLLKVL